MPLSALLDLFKLSFKGLQRHKWRTVMAMGGIIISVAGFVTMGLVGSNARAHIFKEIQTFGIHTIWLYRAFDSHQTLERLPNHTGLVSSDVLLLKQQHPDIKWATPVVEEIAEAQSQRQSRKTKLYYVSQDFFQSDKDALMHGRWFNELDDYNQRRVCVLGADIYQALFKANETFNHSVRINNEYYQVVGVLETKDQDLLKSIGAGAENPNGRIYLPYFLYQKQHGNFIDYIQLGAYTSSAVPDLSKKIITTLSTRHKGLFRYEVTTMKQFIDAANRILKMVSWLLILSLLMALVIGGIGIANMMLLTVRERVQEIGIRKAIGASKSDIFIQFMTESVTLCGFAGVIGVCLGTFLSVLGLIIAGKFLVFYPVILIISFSLSVGVGIISGVYPAHTASKSLVVQALKAQV